MPSVRLTKLSWYIHNYLVVLNQLLMSVPGQLGLERSIYGKMLANTPRAMVGLLDSCIYTVGRTTFVDFFPFFNHSKSGSELNILKVWPCCQRPSAKDQGITRVLFLVFFFHLSDFLFKRNLSEKNPSQPEIKPGSLGTPAKHSIK